LGLKYYLDSASISRAVRKRYIFERVKGQLQDLLDCQIILDQPEMAPAVVIKKTIINGKRKFLDNNKGFIAEIMVTNFLDKLSWDLDADFELIRTDVYEDAKNKIDFAIRRKRHYRGVKIENEEIDSQRPAAKLGLGIQFTIKKEGLGRKRKQVQGIRETVKEGGELDDIVLVRVPLESLNIIFSQWVADGRQPGGPDKLWDTAIKHAIIGGVLKGLMSPEEIQEIKDKVK